MCCERRERSNCVRRETAAVRRLEFVCRELHSKIDSVLGDDVDMVEEYKFLGVSIDNRLNWKANINAVYKKGMSRLIFLRKLRSFVVCSKMLEIFYQSVGPVPPTDSLNW